LEVLEVKVDFKKPSSGSIPESPNINCILAIQKQLTTSNYKSDKPQGNILGQLKDLEISRYKRFFSLERP
jgi:hypothetical protein